MPAETANGLPYPLDSDAPDAPTQIKALAEAIDQIPSALIADLAIIAAKIASEAVETGKIKNLAVTAAKLAEAAVTEGKLGGESVSSAKIKALAVTAAKIAEEAIETGKIKALAVTAAKLAADSVTSTKIAANAVEEAKVKDGAVSSRKFRPTAGVKEASADLVLTAVMQDVAGTSLEITPAVASILRVDLVLVTAGPEDAEAAINVDEVDQAAVAPVVGTSAPTQSAFQVIEFPLTAAAHTIKMRARLLGPMASTLKKTQTRYAYALRAS